VPTADEFAARADANLESGYTLLTPEGIGAGA
jgi:hypothetical protein